MDRKQKLIDFYGGEEELKQEMRRRRQVAIDMGKPAGGNSYATQETRNEVMAKARAGKSGKEKDPQTT